MGGKKEGTGTEFADDVMNPVWGCLNTCEYCYARKIAHRFGDIQESKERALRNKKMIPIDFEEGDFKKFKPVFVEKAFTFREKRQISRGYVFVNSMSDPQFWKGEWMSRVALRIFEDRNIKYMLFTKDIRLLAWSMFVSHFRALDNLMIVFTVNTSAQLERLMRNNFDAGDNYFFKLGLSLEPLQEKIDLTGLQHRFDWFMVGAETGNRKGKIEVEAEWLEQLYSVDFKDKVFLKSSLKNILSKGQVMLRNMW